MALGFVQGTFLNGTASTLTIVKAFTSNVTSGNLLVALCICPTAAGGTFSVSDSQGNTWSSATAVNLPTVATKVIRSEVIAGTTGANTLTITFQFAQSFPELFIGEFNVGGHAATRDDSGGNASSDAGTSFNSASITTTNNPDVLICFIANNGSLTGLTSGWTQNVYDATNGAGFASIVVTTAAAYSLSATQPAGGDESVIYAYKATGTTTVDPGPITGTMTSSGVVTPRLIGATFVQGQFSSNSTGASVPVAFSTSQTAGNLNVIFIASLLSGLTITSVTDSHGQTYRNAIGPISQAGLGADVLQGWAYYCPNIAAGSNTITVTFSAANNFPEIFILEYAGLATSSPLDATASASGASGTSSVSVTTLNANDVIVAGFLNDGQGWNGTPGSGFTNRLFDAGSGNQVDDRSATNSGTYTDTPTNIGGVWMGIALAFKLAGASTILRPGPIAGTMTASGVVIPHIPIRIQISGNMVSSGVVHGTAKAPYLMLSSGSVTVHTVIRAVPLPGLMRSSGVVTPRLIGTVFPMSKGSMFSSGVITLRLNPLRVPVTGLSTSSGFINPHVGIVRPISSGRSTSSGVVIPELIFRPAILAGPITGLMRSTGGQTNPRTVTRAPVTGSSTSSGAVTVRLRAFPTAFGTMLSSGVVTPRLIGTVFPTAFGTMRSSGIVTVQLQPTRVILATRTMLSSGRVNVNLVTPVKPPVIVASTGYYAVIDTWGGNLVVLLTAGVNYSATYQTILGGPYASYWIGIQAMIAILEAIPET